MLACTIGAPQAAMLALDLAVFDGGAAERFLADRGHLLRQDERELLGRWHVRPMTWSARSRSPWLITPSAEPAAPSTLTSSSTCRLVEQPPSRIEPRSTLLSWRSSAQMLLACLASGASRFYILHDSHYV
jgi:hypothetical protein